MLQRKKKPSNLPKRQTKRLGLPLFTPLTGRQNITDDWSLTAGKWPARNDVKQDNKPYNFIQTVTQESLVSTSTTVPTLFGTYFIISQLGDISCLTGLFDQYRIVQLEVWIVPQATSNNGNAIMKSVVDYDNASTPASISAVDNYQNCHTTSLNSGHYRRFTPHAAVAAYTGGAFGGYTNMAAPWIDSASTNVQHYGIKLYLDATTAVVPVDLVTRFHVQFRNKY